MNAQKLWVISFVFLYCSVFLICVGSFVQKLCATYVHTWRLCTFDSALPESRIFRWRFRGEAMSIVFHNKRACQRLHSVIVNVASTSSRRGGPSHTLRQTGHRCNQHRNYQLYVGWFYKNASSFPRISTCSYRRFAVAQGLHDVAGPRFIPPKSQRIPKLKWSNGK